MSGAVNWRQKYVELRAKYLTALDTAFRLGYQEGLKAAQMDAMQQQMQSMQQQMAAQQQAAAVAAGGGQQPQPPGMEGGEEGGEMAPGQAEEGEMSPGAEQPQPGAPDQQQAANQPSDDLDLSINELEQYMKSEKINPKDALSKIHNMKITKKEADAKEVLGKSKKIVQDILSKWDKEADKSAEELAKILGKDV